MKPTDPDILSRDEFTEWFNVRLLYQLMRLSGGIYQVRYEVIYAPPLCDMVDAIDAFVAGGLISMVNIRSPDDSRLIVKVTVG